MQMQPIPQTSVGLSPWTPQQLLTAMRGSAEFRRTLIAEPAFQLTHCKNSLAGGYDVPGMKDHGIRVQGSSRAHHFASFNGSRHEGVGRRGMSWVVPAGVATSWEWEPIEVVAVWLSPTLWRDVLEGSGLEAELHPEVRFVGADPLVEQLVLALQAGADEHHQFGRLLRDGLLAALIMHLAKRQTTRAPAPGPRGGLAEWRLRRVLERMNDALAEDIPLDQLAKLAGLSPCHFSTAFRRSTGTPPHQYLVKQRIARAQSLLRTDHATSVTEVAMSVGFGTSTHFATMFRKLTGKTPSEFRAAS